MNYYKFSKGIFIVLAMIVLSMFFCSCSKEKEITVYGVVSIDGIPKQAATIKVDVGGSTVAQTVSGSDGCYEVRFDQPVLSGWKKFWTDPADLPSTSGRLFVTYVDSRGYMQYQTIGFSFERTTNVQVDVDFSEIY